MVSTSQSRNRESVSDVGLLILYPTGSRAGKKPAAAAEPEVAKPDTLEQQLTKSNVKRVSGDPGEEYLPLSRKFRAVVTGASSSGAGSSTEAGTLGATTAFPRNTRWYAGPP